MKPIEKPGNLFIRIAYFFARRQFGKVIAPLKTIYSRRPALLGFSLRIERRIKNLGISHSLAVMIRTLVAIERNCDFCIDIGKYELEEAGVATAKASALWSFASSELFFESEKAALAFAECLVHRPGEIGPLREKLHPFFTEKQQIDIAWVCAAESYYNVMNKGLGLEADGLCRVNYGERELLPQ